jgi:hypothetical protein
MIAEKLPEDAMPDESALTEKWGSALSAGFQVVPNVLLRAQSRLGLDAVDTIILLNINLHWWEKDSLPYPPPALIASRMGVSRRTVERRIFRLQKDGWLRRLPAPENGEGLKIRKYDLTGLVERLQRAAVAGLSQRSRRGRRMRNAQRGKSLTRGGGQLLLTGNLT